MAALLEFSCLPSQNDHAYKYFPADLFFQQNEVGEISARAVNLSIRARGVTFRVRKQPFSIILMKEQFSSMRAYYLARNGDARIRILSNGDRTEGRRTDGRTSYISWAPRIILVSIYTCYIANFLITNSQLIFLPSAKRGLGKNYYSIWYMYYNNAHAVHYICK